ncbi:MAG: hypothetical protein NZ899_00175 [Thermoguttaceae bacterium]|nr:hypothetical protein [Thermoguttaceae bacterium]MDW8077313.1 hypothetical protein [Thermoguttaceae bacterium]
MVLPRERLSGGKGGAALPDSWAAELTQPGDGVIVHGGVDREEINPPRAGLSPQLRIAYQGAPGEHVEIRG